MTPVFRLPRAILVFALLAGSSKARVVPGRTYDPDACTHAYR
jgi:hypothetical protein